MGGRDERFDRGALFSIESYAVAQYLAEREGPAFVGTLAERLIAGARIDDVVATARGVPANVTALEPAWRAWLADQRPRGR